MQVIDIKIRERRLVARFAEEELELQPKQICLVEDDGDLELAKVKSAPYEWDSDEPPPENETFISRTITDEDLSVYRENRVIEREAYDVALEKVRERELPMALATVERSFDGRKMRFFFTAEQRIDFRELVKDLAHVYKTRIEMRQIGVRDRSKKIGGYSVCGQELCCSRFLQKFDPITIRMAKDQNLSLNPSKISGLCGRLMCCLAYEVEDYQSAKKEFPSPGTKVSTPYGDGVVDSLNYVRETINVSIEEAKPVECKKEEVSRMKKDRNKNES